MWDISSVSIDLNIRRPSDLGPYVISPSVKEANSEMFTLSTLVLSD